tara:strand:- start:23 stop:178 length:156 start_codon:yes stop_codon:yes gene_type:complete
MITQKELILLYYSISDIEEEMYIKTIDRDKILSLIKDIKKTIINRVDEAPH